MNIFEGKTAVISGGAEGIGLSIARALGARKMNIVIADIDTDNLERAKSELQQSGVPVLAVPLDVSDERQWQSVAEAALEQFGNIHMLINNAGVTGVPGAIEDQSASAWQWTLDVNLMGVVYGAKVMIPHIKSHGEGGWLVNVASMAGMGGMPYGGAYTATKTAVVGLSEGWAQELQNDDIAVSVLCPGFVKTRIHESFRNRQPRYESDGEASKAQMDFFNMAKAAVENGIDVSIVGERLVEALQAGEFYVFTHPNFRNILQQRAGMIDAAFERAAKSPLLQDLLDGEPTTF